MAALSNIYTVNPSINVRDLVTHNGFGLVLLNIKLTVWMRGPKDGSVYLLPILCFFSWKLTKGERFSRKKSINTAINCFWNR